MKHVLYTKLCIKDNHIKNYFCDNLTEQVQLLNTFLVKVQVKKLMRSIESS